MKIGELLRKEVWSKSTSQKLKRVLRVVAALLVVYAVWDLVNIQWLTPPERKAGRIALDKIDSLQRFEEMDNTEYWSNYKHADEMVHAAEDVVWTRRDEGFANSLSSYLFLTDVQRQDKERRIKFSNSEDERLRKWSTRSDASAIEGLQLVSGFLHQALK